MIEDLSQLLDRSRRAGWGLLPESAGLRMLQQLGIQAPMTQTVASGYAPHPADLARFPGNRLVLKVDCPDLAHKSEVGGVRVVPKEVAAVREALAEMGAGLGGQRLQGFLLQEYVEAAGSPGVEILLGFIWDREFGPVLCVGSGGLNSEVLTRSLIREAALAVMPLEDQDVEALGHSLEPLLVSSLITRGQRGQPPLVSMEDLTRSLQEWARRAVPLLVGGGVDELEINPLVIRDGSPVALDVLVRLTQTRPVVPPRRPIEKIRCLLEPRSIALIGVSTRLNPGHMILRNLLRQGFDRRRIWVIKPGLDEIEGCRCVPDLEDLPRAVDLLVVAVAATQVPELLTRVVEERRAESLIVIPGGLEERRPELGRRWLESLYRSRQTEWGGPVVNGGNCMGLRSEPGSLDTFFLPDHKLSPVAPSTARAALIAQSGAFLAARISKLEGVALKYAISLGNQTDLTVGDFLEYLSGDSDLELVAVYVEGFRALDGLQFLRCAARITREGRRVILYRAGRTPEGTDAAASHTASLAGSFDRTAALARSAGVLFADTVADFEDLISLGVRLAGRTLGSPRVALVSNAGFECVAAADRLQDLTLAHFSGGTKARLQQLLARAGASEVVDVRNPLDLTPMMSDRPFAEAVEAVLEDPGVGAAVVGCVPLTGALNTLERSPRHDEDFTRDGSLASRLIELWQRSEKPWVTVVDGGRDYDAMAAALARQGIPVFRHIDRAVSMLERWLVGLVARGSRAARRDAQG